jgi:hypothetical protein
MSGRSVGAFLADVGNLWPAPIAGTRRKVWDRLALDQAVERLPGAVIADWSADLAATRDARRRAYEEEQRKRAARIADKG